MPAKVYTGGGYLGETILEKTRSILGWSNQDSLCTTIERNSRATALRRHSPSGNCRTRRGPYTRPYGRSRKNSSSSSSTCSDYSQPSPSYSIRSYPESISPEPFHHPYDSPPAWYPPQNPAYRSAEHEARVFERLRQLVPVLPADRNPYQILIDTVSQVMDLEPQLEQFSVRTEEVKNSFRKGEEASVDDECVFPDDLRSVDVTAFKHLIYSDPPVASNFNNRYV